MTDQRREEIFDPTPERDFESVGDRAVNEAGSDLSDDVAMNFANAHPAGEPSADDDLTRSYHQGELGRAAAVEFGGNGELGASGNSEFSDGAPMEAYASEEEAIVDINALDLEAEPIAPVDIEKMEEQVAYAPTLKPGAFHQFIFKLDGERQKADGKMEQPWQPVKGKPSEAQFNYSARNIKEDGSEGKEIRYQSASTFKSEKMTSSKATELLYALGKLKLFNASERRKQDMLDLLADASKEQVVFEGQVQWRHYDSTTGVTISTAPSKPYKKKVKDAAGNLTGEEVTVTEQAWPRDEKGQFIRHPGQEQIVRVRPTKENQEAQKKDAA